METHGIFLYFNVLNNLSNVRGRWFLILRLIAHQFYMNL